MDSFGQRRNASLAVARLATIATCACAVLGMSARCQAGDDMAPDRPWPWPCRLMVIGELRASAELAWEHSPTFREQCRKLAAAGATLIVEPATPRELWRATTEIRKTQDGFTFARARVRPAKNAPELIAHELEHVIEFTDGVRLLMEAKAGRSGVSLSAGSYETRRAIEAGRRVAQEVRGARVQPSRIIP